MLKKGLIALLGTATCSLIVNPAPVQAYSLNGSLKCNTTDITGASACSGSYTLDGGENDVTNGGSSNIATQLLNSNGGVFGGGGGWEFGFKDNSLNGSSGFTKAGDGTTGTFDTSKIDSRATEIAISLKSSKGFSLYRITKDSWSGLDSIDWSTIGTSQNKQNKAQALSHASVYYRFTTHNDGGKQKTPEPASGLALLAIGAVAAKGVLRKKSAEASIDA